MTRKSIFYSLVPRIVAVLAAMAVCAWSAPAAADETGELALIKNFRYDFNGAVFLNKYLAAHECYLDIALLKKDAGRYERIRLQRNDGRVNSIEEFKPENAAAAQDTSQVTPGLKRGKNGALASKFSADGTVNAAVEFSFEKKKYAAAIAEDYALYIFSLQAPNGQKPPCVYKVHIDKKPLDIYNLENQFFIVTADYLCCFEIRKANGAASPALAGSCAAAKPMALLRENLVFITDSNEFDREIEYYKSDIFRFHEVSACVPPAASAGGNSIIAYFTGSFGNGNRNIHSLNDKFEIERVSAFSGYINDFQTIKTSPPSFLIEYSKRPPDGARRDKSYWKFEPPFSLAAPSVDIMSRSRFYFSDTRENIFATSEITTSGGFAVAYAGGTDETLINYMTVDCHDANSPDRSFLLTLPSAVKKGAASPGVNCAVSGGARPMFAYYDAQYSRMYIFDVKLNRLHDNFYFNPGRGKIVGMKFSGDGDYLAVREDYPGGTAGGGNAFSTSLFIYRVRNKLFERICNYRALGSFDFIAYKKRSAVILSFGARSGETDSLGIILL